MDQNKDNKLLRLKKKLSQNHMYSIVLTVLAITLGFGMYQYKQKLNYQQYLQNRFQESFYEMVTYVNNVDTVLAKVRLARKPQQSAPLFAELWKEASSAQNNMGEVPYNHTTVDRSLKFLSQVSDFAFSMSKKAMDGNELDEEDWEKVNQIQGYAKQLTTELNKVQQQVHDGNRINWKEIQNEGAAALKDAEEGKEQKALTGSIANVNKAMEDIPSLIYDGPFSDHIEKMEPRMTRGKKKVSKEEAEKIVKKFIGEDRIEKVELTGETDTKVEHTIPVYSYSVQLKDEKDPTIAIDITQEGGLPLWMLNYSDRKSEGKEISIEEARKKAEKFLEERNYPDMKPSYYEKVDGTTVINFAPQEDKVIMYPDLIKVKIAMDDGEAIGFEALGYVMMHHKRDLPEIKITEEEAREEITTDFDIEKVNMAVIPLESKREVLCYEFKGKYDESDFIVYINAESGKEEKILQILKSDNAILTQ